MSKQPKTTITIEKERRQAPLRRSVEVAIALYFSHLDGDQPANLYEMVIAETEYGLLKSVLEHTQGNQSKAAECLGINRGTLRKKLKAHQLA